MSQLPVAVPLPRDFESDPLLARARQGDRSALSALLGLHRARLRRLIAGGIDRGLAARVDASDIIQDAMMIAVKRFPEYLRDRRVPFGVWLGRLGRQAVADARRFHLRRKRTVRAEVGAAETADGSVGSPVERLVDGGPTPSGLLEQREQLTALQAALAGLPPATRDILELYYFENLTCAQIGERLGKEEGAVRVQIFRALRRLRPLLKPN